MNLKLSTFLAFGVLFFHLSSCTSNSSDTDLLNVLENSYTQHMKSLQSGDEELIKQTMSSFSHATKKNIVTNLKKSFVSEMKKGAKYFPNITNMDFVKVLRKGPTAALLYSKDSEFRDMPDQPKIDFTFIKFVNEDGKWKFDGLRIANDIKFQTDGSLTQFDESSLSSELAIDGIVRSAPPLVAEVEVAGLIDVASIGYKTEVIINNNNQLIINDTTKITWIRGGLKFGENNIKITVEKIDDKTHFTHSVTVRDKITADFIEIFKFEPKEDIEGKHTFTFFLSEEMISNKSINPTSGHWS